MDGESATGGKWPPTKTGIEYTVPGFAGSTLKNSARRKRSFRRYGTVQSKMVLQEAPSARRKGLKSGDWEGSGPEHVVGVGNVHVFVDRDDVLEFRKGRE
jgi:hypothetical protein